MCKSDFLCRYGGDAFIVVTPMRTCKANGPLFARIEKSLEEWNATYATFDYRLSMSIGCEVWEKGRDIIEVLHEADGKMYLHKQSKKQVSAYFLPFIDVPSGLQSPRLAARELVFGRRIIAV